jgi:hypothetical protein
MNDIRIIDDFLPPYLQDKLEEICYGGIDFKFFKKTLSFEDEKFYDSSQFVSIFKLGEEIKEKNYMHYFQIPFQVGFLNMGMDYNFSSLNRLKINLCINDHKEVKNKINPPHIDPIPSSFKNSFIGIYYVNESDGDTIIYKNNNLEIEEQVSPKKGRLLIMNGNRLHSSSHPSINEYRIIINCNIAW